MSISGEIKSLYLDREENTALFPRTKTKAVSDDNGVGLDVLLDGKAPSGYGLGVFDTSNPITKEELNNPTGNGWRFISADRAEWGDILPSTIWGVVRIDGFDTAWCTETIYDSYWGWNLTRGKGGGSGWTPWEWINPPMIPGVEYRTTERWNERPVFTMLVNCNAGPNKGITETPIPAENFERGIFCSVHAVSGGSLVLPVMGISVTGDFSCAGIVNGYVRISSNVDCTGYIYYATVKYLKQGV